MVGGGGLGWYIIKCNFDGDILWSLILWVMVLLMISVR